MLNSVESIKKLLHIYISITASIHLLSILMQSVYHTLYIYELIFLL